MDFQESDEIRELRSSLKRFIERHMPREAAADWDSRNYFPRDVFKKLAELGVMGLTIPTEYGGYGRNILAAMITIEELSKRSLAVSVPYIMATCYAGMNIVECASEAQKREFLPKIVNGDLLFAYGWTEPDVGADLASIKTRCERRGDTLIINGEKRFCSGAAISDYIFTLVRTGDPQDRHRNISIVLIPPTSPGVSITPINALGMKGAATTDIVFDNVEVPIANLFGGEEKWNQGWGMITGSGLDVERIEVAAIALGIAQAALDDAFDYAQQRVQFGQQIGMFQSIKHKLAEMATQVQAARLMVYQGAWACDQHSVCTKETAMAKLFAAETAKAVALECQTIFGAYGYVKGFDVERYVRDAILMPIIGGSSAVQKNNIYKQLFR
jgi:alkylation response protein AidB-like acyl-CoA dehydrogenase